MYPTPYLLGFGMMAIQAFCIWHCIRHRKPLWWLILILMGFGVFWYLIFELRDGSVSRGGRSPLRAKLINLNPVQIKASPGLIRELEMERQRGDTVDLRIKLAEAHMELGDAALAVDLFTSCLKGHHKDDPVIIFGLAQAHFQNGQLEEALAQLEAFQKSGRTDYPNERALLEARVRAGLGENEKARNCFNIACRLPGEEARCEYALFLKRTGETDEAMELFGRIVQNCEAGDRDFIRRNSEWLAIARAELQK